MESQQGEPVPIALARYADQFAALGSEARLGILRLLLAAHPRGMVVGELQQELAMAPSTLSHHLERLKTEGLIVSAREGTFLRYTAHDVELRNLLAFLWAECCSRNRPLAPEDVLACCGDPNATCAS
ncbi:MAG: metalloregulator ArsR/SmtB family transcription factor [Acidobacteria bacterium]|nr:metalloregulator ArsR/SmtB family transcription factor [Acidobacteriota bacterium]